VEEHPFNIWDVEVTEWVWCGIVLVRRLFFKTCTGMDSQTAKPHVEWRFGSCCDLVENTERPAGCLRVSGLSEVEL
jgi:hypothetical protein